MGRPHINDARTRRGDSDGERDGGDGQSKGHCVVLPVADEQVVVGCAEVTAEARVYGGWYRGTVDGWAGRCMRFLGLRGVNSVKGKGKIWAYVSHYDLLSCVGVLAGNMMVYQGLEAPTSRSLQHYLRGCCSFCFLSRKFYTPIVHLSDVKPFEQTARGVLWLGLGYRLTRLLLVEGG